MSYVVSKVFANNGPGDPEHVLDAWVEYGSPNMYKEKVKFSDEKLAHDMGLYEAKIPTIFGRVTIDNGVDFIRNMWKFFSGSSYYECDRPTSVMEPPATMHKRSSERGEPNIDELEDVEGQYRRFQQREHE